MPHHLGIWKLLGMRVKAVGLELASALLSLTVRWGRVPSSLQTHLEGMQNENKQDISKILSVGHGTEEELNISYLYKDLDLKALNSSPVLSLLHFMDPSK